MSLYARTLGQMQARILRLDSLGEKLVEVSSLDKKEFDFGLQPAFGGPRLVPASLAGKIGLSDHMQHISTRLSNLDTQLAAIDYLLQGDRIEKNAKPHAWPSEGGWLSSRFGMRADPFTGERAVHRGVDIANRFGAPVLSTSRGIVTFAGKMKDFGYMVDIEHGYGYKTRYGHLSSLAVKVGDEVSDSQLVGRVGSSGRSTGPHLHYEVHRNGKSLNPATFLPRG
jgi:murein DD-endopeptidase MepM/ murein hydrolase activator NlpD